MAEHTVTRSKHFTLTGDPTVDIVNLATGHARSAYTSVEVKNKGAVEVSFAVSNGDPTNPTVGGDNTYAVGPGESLVVPVNDRADVTAPDGTVRVELTAASAAAVSVTGLA